VSYNYYTIAIEKKQDYKTCKNWQIPCDSTNLDENDI